VEEEIPMPLRLRLLALGLLLALASPASAATFTYATTLGPESVGATGSGSTTVIYDDAAHTLSITTDWSGLSGTTTVAHIHCCVATPGSGTVGVAVTPSTLPGFPTGVQAGNYSVTLDLTDVATYTGSFLAGGTASSAEAALVAGLNTGVSYFNIHSSTFGGGEIRGFLTPVPEPSSTALLAGVLCLAAGIAARNSKPA
jgi:hypothetical protein